MKSITKLSCVTASLAVTARTTTVALYANHRGLGRSETPATATEARFVLRSNAHGQAFGAFGSATK